MVRLFSSDKNPIYHYHDNMSRAGQSILSVANYLAKQRANEFTEAQKQTKVPTGSLSLAVINI